MRQQRSLWDEYVPVTNYVDALLAEAAVLNPSPRGSLEGCRAPERDLMAQLRRDLETYDGPPEYWGADPGREFYARRIQLLRETLAQF